jgi:hypothetical protein
MDGDFEMAVINILNEIFGRRGKVLVKVLIVRSLVMCGATGGQYRKGHIQQQQPKQPRKLIYFHVGRLTHSLTGWQWGEDRIREPLQFLPDQGNEPIMVVPAVLGIAGQFASKHFLLVEQPENNHRDDEGKDWQGDIRAECQRGGKLGHDDTRIHRMTNETVRTDGGNGLAGFDLNDACGKTVGLQDRDKPKIAAQNNSQSQQGEPPRHRPDVCAGPPGPIIPAGKYKSIKIKQS